MRNIYPIFYCSRPSPYSAANCGDGIEEGDVRLDPNDDGQTLYYLLQVCLLGNWTYVCQGNFDHANVDKNVVLQQLHCRAGG